MTHEAPDRPDAPHADPHPEATPPRVFAGGVLMGLANLVPGVSGGTMILALGLYDRFIEAVAELARLRPSVKTLVFVGVLGAGLVGAVVALATPAVWLVTEHRWIAYSLFIGMTLGGVPMLWRIVRPADAGVVAGAAAGLGLMAAVAFGLQDASLPHTLPVFFAAGAIAASSMILPGISGSYILLILGLYDVVIGSLRPGELQADPTGSLSVVAPVVVGAAVGVGLLSNLLSVVLKRFERVSHAVLLGLLVGSVLGLWPFQRPVHPDLADERRLDVVKEMMEGASASEAGAPDVGLSPGEADALVARYRGRTPAELELLGLELEAYPPPLGRAALALLFLALGFGITRALGGGGATEAGAASPTA